jgi:histidine ammonia-lyase
VKEIEQEIGAAAQALDLRLRANASVRLGQGTVWAHAIIRSEVSYLERDRFIMDDARRMVELVRKGRILK